MYSEVLFVHQPGDRATLRRVIVRSGPPCVGLAQDGRGQLFRPVEAPKSPRLVVFSPFSFRVIVDRGEGRRLARSRLNIVRKILLSSALGWPIMFSGVGGMPGRMCGSAANSLSQTASGKSVCILVPYSWNILDDSSKVSGEGIVTFHQN
jgi:hypothetical protein